MCLGVSCLVLWVRQYAGEMQAYSFKVTLSVLSSSGELSGVVSVVCSRNRDFCISSFACWHLVETTSVYHSLSAS